MFGHPTRGDERMLLRLDPNGDVHSARGSSIDGGEWRLLSGWAVRRNAATFSDFTTGREFSADLGYSTLGGRWNDALRSGGWWCLAIEAADGPGTRVGSRDPEYWLPPLIPEVMATPWYPRQAIRAAKEGNAVACFTVDAEGTISAAALIELSDEIFRNPTLSALQRSSYVGWNDAVPARPGCRSFSFELESIFR